MNQVIVGRAATSPRGGVLGLRWWTLVVRGVAVIAFGLLALALPPGGRSTLVFLWGSFAFADAIWGAVLVPCLDGDRLPWGWLVLEGHVSVVAGVLAFFTHVTAAELVMVIAAWAVLTGFAEIAAAVRVRRLLAPERALAAIGTVASGIGAVLLAVTGPRAFAHPWVIDAYAVVFGSLLIALGVGVLRWSRSAA